MKRFKEEEKEIERLRDGVMQGERNRWKHLNIKRE